MLLSWIRPKLMARAFFALWIAVGVGSVLGFLSEYGWILNLTSHFRLQYTVIMLLAVIVFLRSRQKGRAGTSLILFLLNVYAIYSASANAVAQGEHGAGTSELKFLQMNLLVRNRNYDAIWRCIEIERADIVAMEELTPEIWRELQGRGIERAYPYRLIAFNGPGNSQNALLSKMPLEDARVDYAYEPRDPTIIATVRDGAGCALTVLVAHPRPPVCPDFLVRQVRHFRKIVSLRGQFEGPVVVMGDLNTTPWAEPFVQLTRGLGVRDSRGAIGFLPSWPVYCPLVCLPIDYILVGDGIAVRDFHVAPLTGSDHAPIAARVVF